METPTIITREQTDKKTIRGYAIVFEKQAPADWLGEGWQEQIAKSAFDDIDFSDTKILFGHDTTMPLGKNGINARIEKDDAGIFVEVDLLDTSIGRDTYINVKAGIIDGMSFAAMPSKWSFDEDNKVLTWEKFENLREVSFVAFPFYEQTTAIAKELEPIKKELEVKKEEAEDAAKEIENLLKEVI